MYEAYSIVFTKNTEFSDISTFSSTHSFLFQKQEHSTTNIFWMRHFWTSDFAYCPKTKICYYADTDGLDVDDNASPYTYVARFSTITRKRCFLSLF